MKYRSRFTGMTLAAVTVVGFQLSGAPPVFAASTTGAAIHYSAAYSMDFTGFTAEGYTGPADLGIWSCSGVRVTNKNTVRDNFTCSTTATDVTATFSQNAPWPCGCVGWVSDFDNKSSTNYEVDIANGTVNGWAIYG
jgi:hypothetical protein